MEIQGMNIELEVNEETELLGQENLTEILSIYRNIYNASGILVESITQLGRLELVDQDIKRINELDIPKSKELLSLASEIHEFIDKSPIILGNVL